MPRWIGNPHQSLCRTQEQFLAFIKHNNGTAPVFTSHNAHPEKGKVLIERVPFDFDAEEKRENALHDLLKWKDWAEDLDFETRFAFSGNKGFHGYLEFEPVLAENNRALKRLYRGIQSRAREDASLRTVDRKLEGDTRRLMRVVNSKHQESGKYCIELGPSEIKNADMERILDMADSPRPAPDLERPSETFQDVVERLELTPRRDNVRERSEGAATVPYDEDTPAFVKAVLPRPCIHNNLMSRNPSHMIRVEACSTMSELGYDIQFLLEFFDQIAEEAEWVDRHRKDIRDYHVWHLFRQEKHYRYSCQRIRSEGLCIGQECPLFEKIWPDEVEAESEFEP